MKTIKTQRGLVAKIDNVNFAGFDKLEGLAYFHRGITYALNSFIETTFSQEEILDDRTACDIAFALEGQKNTTDYIFSLLAGHIHSLEDQLGYLHDEEIDLIIDNPACIGREEGGEQ